MIQRPGPIALLLAGLVCVFLLAPLLAVVRISFTPARFLTMPNGHLSLIHYRELIDNPDWARSILLSLRIGVVSSAIATALRRAHGRLCPLADDRAADCLGNDSLFLPDKPLRSQRRDRL